MKRTILLTLIFTVFHALAFADFGQQKEVIIYAQPDSPLRLSNPVPKQEIITDNNGQDYKMMSVEFVNENVSGKSIRAYAIRVFEGDFDKDVGMTDFGYATRDSALLKPYQTRIGEIGESSFSEKAESIKIAVDFVEFTDGSVWGADITKSAQILAGLRAGAEASLEFLKNINKQNGFEAVIKSLDEIKVAPPENQCSQWNRGFRSGTSVIKFRIKKIYETQGKQTAEAELQKPFDPPSSN